MASYRSKTPTSDGKEFSTARFRNAFKSPLLNRVKDPNGNYDTQTSDKDVLKENIAKIDEEINAIGIEYSEEELQMHIDKLHEYNEIKDVGQLLLGKIAELEGKTTKMIYEEYGLDLED